MYHQFYQDELLSLKIVSTLAIIFVDYRILFFGAKQPAKIYKTIRLISIFAQFWPDLGLFWL